MACATETAWVISGDGFSCNPDGRTTACAENQCRLLIPTAATESIIDRPVEHQKTDHCLDI
jgi:hypothetical protein